MKTSHLTVINLVMGLLLASPFLVQMTTSAGVYDPWSDLNADGEIDIFDVVTVAGAYRTTGDPTKSVYVQNWPVTTQQTVFYFQSYDEISEWYNASGFGHLHLTWIVSGLADSGTVTVRTWVRIQNPAGEGYTAYTAHWLDVTAANYEGSLSFPVPAEMFQFTLTFAPGTTAIADLAFYLTYA